MGPIEAQFMQMLANGSQVAAPAWILGAVVVLPEGYDNHPNDLLLA